MLLYDLTAVSVKTVTITNHINLKNELNTQCNVAVHVTIVVIIIIHAVNAHSLNTHSTFTSMLLPILFKLMDDLPFNLAVDQAVV